MKTRIYAAPAVEGLKALNQRLVRFKIYMANNEKTCVANTIMMFSSIMHRDIKTVRMLCKISQVLLLPIIASGGPYLVKNNTRNIAIFLV